MLTRVDRGEGAVPPLKRLRTECGSTDDDQTPDYKSEEREEDTDDDDDALGAPADTLAKQLMHKVLAAFGSALGRDFPATAVVSHQASDESLTKPKTEI